MCRSNRRRGNHDETIVVPAVPVVTKRRRFSEREVLRVLYYSGYNLRCFRCEDEFGPYDKIEREHLHELALGGNDEPYNCRYSHAKCHKIVTNGIKTTTAGSSKQRIAKAKRSKKMLVDKPPTGERKPKTKKYRWVSRPLRGKSRIAKREDL